MSPTYYGSGSYFNNASKCALGAPEGQKGPRSPAAKEPLAHNPSPMSALTGCGSQPITQQRGMFPSIL
jgi:hypothetical protein